jgi:hypothetical protein
MDKQVFKINLEAPSVVVDEDKEIKQYSLYLPTDNYLFFNDYISSKVKKGNLSFNLKKAFLEGLEALMKKNPDLVIQNEIPRRYYRGGKQKNALEVYRSSILITVQQIKWINSYIAESQMKEVSYSQADFIQELVNLLKEKSNE